MGGTKNFPLHKCKCGPDLEVFEVLKWKKLFIKIKVTYFT